MTDDQAIGALLKRYETAIHDRDAHAAVACYAHGVVAYDMAPPLAQNSDRASNIAGFQEWFDTWDGPIGANGTVPRIRVGGDIAYAYSLRHMTGIKKGDTHVDLWFRSTTLFDKRDGSWRIAHVHSSVPFAMDGSGKALLDLKP
jgi:ketosteroid isomerase-like protein